MFCDQTRILYNGQDEQNGQTPDYLTQSYQQEGGFLGISMNFIGRLFIAALFIVMGIRSLTNFTAYTATIQSLGLPNPKLLASISVVVQIIGGLLFTGIFALNSSVTIGQILLILYMIAATYLNNNAFVDPSQMENMLKNLAILGGLLLA